MSKTIELKKSRFSLVKHDLQLIGDLCKLASFKDSNVVVNFRPLKSLATLNHTIQMETTTLAKSEVEMMDIPTFILDILPQRMTMGISEPKGDEERTAIRAFLAHCLYMPDTTINKEGIILSFVQKNMPTDGGDDE